VKSRYRLLQLVVHEDLTPNLLERLRDYQIEAALLALPVEDENAFEAAPLFDEPFWFACHPRHPLAQLKAVTEGDLCAEPMLLLADGHCLRGQALAACGRAASGEDGLDDFRAASLETLCQLVAAGFGSTLLPALAARPRSPEAGFVIRPLHSPNARRRIGLVWRRGYARTGELEMLADLVRDNPPVGTCAIVDDRQALRAGII
jgi:LysR family hydrogen peroxide-inducible transcriptional activator